MSQPVRPRPRPKPKAKNAAGPSTAAIDHDSDEMFMRNTTRNLSTWRKLEQKNKEVKAHGSDDEEDGPESPRKKSKKKKDVVPSWQKTKNAKVFAIEISDDDDEDFALQGIENTPNKSKLKRKRGDRQRSRSRSITPPPAIPIHQLQNARNVIRQALAAPPRAASPSQWDDINDVSTDTIILDPELDRLAKQSAASFRSSPLPRETSLNDTVEITVVWKPHPLNEQGQSEKSVFKMNKTDSFRELFEAVADQESIPVDGLVMTYKNMRFFPSVTPNTLDIWGAAEFLAYNKATFDYLRSQLMLPKQNVLISESANDSNGPLVVVSDDEDFGFGQRMGSLAPETDHEDDGPDDKFKLNFKSQVTPGEITLTVRPTTTCGAIVKAFLKKAGLAAQYPHVMNGTAPSPTKKRGRNAAPPKDPRLCIDGDKMDNATEIGEMDLEDGDLVDVVGL